MSEPDYRAMCEALRVQLKLAENDRDASRRVAEDLAQRLADETGEDVHLQWPCVSTAPNPDYTPAVRRVEAWEVGGVRYTSRESAYLAAADKRIWELQRKRQVATRDKRLAVEISRDWDRRYPTGLHRLASLFLHWDEKEGYR